MCGGDGLWKRPLYLFCSVVFYLLLSHADMSMVNGFSSYSLGGVFHDVMAAGSVDSDSGRAHWPAHVPGEEKTEGEGLICAF